MLDSNRWRDISTWDECASGIFNVFDDILYKAYIDKDLFHADAYSTQATFFRTPVQISLSKLLTCRRSDKGLFSRMHEHK